jgi:hypothetical protein
MFTRRAIQSRPQANNRYLLDCQVNLLSRQGRLLSINCGYVIGDKVVGGGNKRVW